MIEPGQVIVQKWFEMQGYFLQTNVKYKVPRNYSDIDLIGINKNGEGLVVEVKSWVQYAIGVKEGKDLIRRLSSNKTLSRKIERTIGKRKTKKVLVLTQLSKWTMAKLDKFAKARHVQIVTMDNLLTSLIQHLDLGPSYDDEALQVLRIIKAYKKRGMTIVSAI